MPMSSRVANELGSVALLWRVGAILILTGTLLNDVLFGMIITLLPK